MEIGIIGLPNTGKSTLFNALTSLKIPTGKYPFTTVEPNIAVVLIPDERLKKLGEVFKPEKLTSAIVKFIDIAGLVKDAHKGVGLGNKFLSYIREVDALIQVLRCFEQSDVVNVLEKIDPREEISIVELELILADLEVVTKVIEKMRKAKDKNLEYFEKIFEELNKNTPIRNQNIPPEISKQYNFLTSKPILYVLNTDEKTKIDLNSMPQDTIQINAKLEEEMLEFNPIEREKMLQELGFSSSIDKVVKAAFNLLHQIVFYTVVGKEVKAWSIPEGTVVKEAAGKIHSDMEKGFICAEVISFDEFIKFGLENKKVVGKDYIVSDGDIVEIKFSR